MTYSRSMAQLSWLCHADLLKRIVTVSMETNRIVASLPPLNERDVTL